MNHHNGNYLSSQISSHNQISRQDIVSQFLSQSERQATTLGRHTCTIRGETFTRYPIENDPNRHFWQQSDGEVFIEAERRNNEHLRQFIQEHGTTSQVERFDHQLLAWSEITKLVQTVLFDRQTQKTDLRRYSDETKEQFIHVKCVCGRQVCQGKVTFKAHDVVDSTTCGLNDAQFKRYKTILRIFPKYHALKIRKLTGSCSHCDSTCEQYTALVLLSVNASTFGVRYHLDDPRESDE